MRSLRRRIRGFTLVELMVALLAGLIVGMSVVALSKEVTNTFHEEARVITAESAIRTAMDRLRSDIQRASMMSTGNAAADPGAMFGVSTAPNYKYLIGMAGVRIITGGSVSANTGSYFNPSGINSGEPAIPAAVNNLAPDMIEVTGNLSSNADYYSVQQLLNGGSGTGSCGGPRLRISSTDAIYRFGDPDSGTGQPLVGRGLQLAFIPNAPLSGTPTSRFFARVIDRNSGSLPLPQQYVLVCNAGFDVANNSPYVDLDPLSVLTSGGTGGDGGTAQVNLGEGMIISPVTTVRWRVAVSPTGGPYDAALNPTNDPTKFDLIRTFLDASGNEVGGPDNPQGEVVAEYIVDLKFSLSVDTTPAGNPDAGPVIANIPFDSPLVQQWAGPVSAMRVSVALGPGSPSPQRVRSVGIRLASRTALPDRTIDLAEDAAPYLYRYAVGDAGQYARVRTLSSEVFLTNQETATYP